MTRAILVLSLLIGGIAYAQPQHMDPDQLPQGNGEPPEILLLTFGEGVQIFEKFGHAALCIHYRSEKIPVQRFSPAIQQLLAPIADKTGIPIEELPRIACVNYGVTDFREGPPMIWHFLRTEQKFWADTESMISMYIFYSGRDRLGKQLEEDRDIWIQRLPLAADQARAIEARIKSTLVDDQGQVCPPDHNAPNCYYYYDHFFNNCTTRLRDFMDDATGGKLSAGTKDVDYPLTFREMGRRGLAEIPPLIGTADYVLGRQLDDTPTLWQAMFHPDVLRDQVRLKLGAQPVQIYKRTGPDFPQDGSTFRGVLFGVALVFTLPLLVAYWRRRFQRVALAWTALYLFVWGLLVYTLVSISSIPGVRWNEAVFVVMPFDIALPFLGERKRRGYARIRVVMLLLVSLLDAIGVFHQPLWIPVLSVMMPMAIVAFDLPHALIARARKAKPAAPTKPAEAA